MNKSYKKISTFSFILFCLLINIRFLNSSDYNFYSNSFIQSASGLTSFEGCDYINNPALLNYVDSSIISLSISPLRFGIPELSPAQLFVASNISRNFSTGFSFSGIGNKLFSEFSGTAIFSYSLGDKLIVGASLEYSYLFVKNYSSEGIFLLHLGALLKLNEILTAGFSMNNVLRAYYSGGENTAKQKALLGLGVKLTQSLFLDLNALINVNYSSGLSFACKYDIIDFISLKLAYLTNPAVVEAGIKMNFSDAFNLSFNANYHNFLGFSQRIMLNYLW